MDLPKRDQSAVMLRRMVPKITPMNEYFWTAGKQGVLKIMHCAACARFFHPFVGRCPNCRSKQIAPKAVSGNGVVVGVTVNHQPWLPEIDVPYIVALIALDEQDDIRLLSDMCDLNPDEIHIGTPVTVYFEEQNEIYIPLFRPRKD